MTALRRYEELLAADGLTIDSLRSADHSEFKLPGSYRPLLQKPGDPEWELLKFSDETLPLQVTDRSLMEAAAAGDAAKLTGADAEGQHFALRVTFTLPPASYATMCLRELMKQSTETSKHAELNDLLSRPHRTERAYDGPTSGANSIPVGEPVPVALPGGATSAKTEAAAPAVKTEVKHTVFT
jgi:hypothetical protein